MIETPESPEAGYITLAAAEIKYQVASRVIQRMISTKRLGSSHQRGGPLYVNEAELQALQAAGELVDKAAGAAAASSRKRGGA